MEISNCVYRFLNEDKEVIYIGKTKNLKNNLQSHDYLPAKVYNEVSSIEFCIQNTNNDTDTALRYYISKYNPKHNTLYTVNTITYPIPYLDQVKWYQYSYEDFIKFKLNHKQTLPITNQNETYKKTEHIDKLEKTIVLFTENIQMQESLYNYTSNIIKEKYNQYKYTPEYKINIKDYIFIQPEGWCVHTENTNTPVNHLNSTESVQELLKLYENIKYIYKEYLELGRIYKKLKAERFCLICKEKDIQNIDKEIINNMVRYDALTIESLKEKLIEELISEVMDLVTSIIDKNECYGYTEFVTHTALAAQNRNDVWNKLFSEEDRETSIGITNDIVDITNYAIKEIEARLRKLYGEFEEYMYIENIENEYVDSRIAIPTACLARKLKRH